MIQTTYFDYPLDTKLLLRKKRAIRRELLSVCPSPLKKRIAVLGGSTTNEIVDQLELFLLHHGIDAEFYQSEYGQYFEDAIFGNETLDCFAPDVIFIHTNWRNVKKFPDNGDDIDAEKMLVDAEYARYESIWETLRSKFGCVIIQNNFERPDYRLLGNRDIWDSCGRSGFLAALNQRFYSYARQHDGFYINDLDYLAAEYGLSAWNDPICWNSHKYCCPIDAIPYLAQSVANIVKSVYGKNKKLLALDLDNTLWGGVIGDDGAEGIQIGTETPSGQTFLAFQSYLKSLQRLGVLLAVDSKNDEANALAGLAHPSGILKKDDFVSIKANWNPKDQNLREIAEELSLGLDSFVFVDDNPAEREIVSAQLPMVETPRMDGAENYIRVLDHSGFFEATTRSAEDGNKTASYQARSKALKAQSLFSDYGQYLKSLEMKAVIYGFEPLYVQRVAQLTNKSNQFNLTTLRCSEADIQRMQNDPQFVCLCARLIDKFTDNGIVTVVAGEIKGDELHIRLWLMSCRVLKRGLEECMMNLLVEICLKQGIRKILGYYYPTEKNGMVREFYKSMQFANIDEDTNGSSVWKLSINEYKKFEPYMQVLYNELKT